MKTTIGISRRIFYKASRLHSQLQTRPKNVFNAEINLQKPPTGLGMYKLRQFMNKPRKIIGLFSLKITVTKIRKSLSVQPYVSVCNKDGGHAHVRYGQKYLNTITKIPKKPQEICFTIIHEQEMRKYGFTTPRK